MDTAPETDLMLTREKVQYFELELYGLDFTNCGAWKKMFFLIMHPMVPRI